MERSDSNAINILPDDGEYFDNVVFRTVIRPAEPTSEVIQFFLHGDDPKILSNFEIEHP